MFDLLFSNAELIDGSGRPRRTADVAVSGDRIAAVCEPGSIPAEAARRNRDLTGKILAPGFIDVHTHDDRLLLEPRCPHPKLSQGVTTVVTGNCGISLAPLTQANPPAPLDILTKGSSVEAEPWHFPNFSAYLECLERKPLALNAVCLVGHTNLRLMAMKDLNRKANTDEAAMMGNMLEEALRAGAWGMSTGVFYPPARAADLEELTSVGACLKEYGAILTSHIRNEAEKIDLAIAEALELGRRLEVPLVISHHKLVGVQNHGGASRTLNTIRQAALKQSVCIDCYPYDASSTMLIPERVAQSREIMISWSEAMPKAAGRLLSELAAELAIDPTTLAKRLLPAGAIYFAMSEGDVEQILADPMTMIGSDGLVHDENPHPRLWGTFPRVLGHYARHRGLFSLEQAVHKMSGLSAARFQIPDRGLVREGCYADLVIFDAQKIADTATFALPIQAATGIDEVYVNGVLSYCPNPEFQTTMPISSLSGQLIKRH